MSSMSVVAHATCLRCAAAHWGVHIVAFGLIRQSPCDGGMTNARVVDARRFREWRAFRTGPDMQRLFLTALLATIASSAHAADACLDRALQAHAFAGDGQLAIAALSPDGSRDTRVLGTAASGAGLQGDEGFRLASITKTYVAATALRLYEDGRLDLHERRRREHRDPRHRGRWR